jgi:hypothetical protein
VLVTLTQAQTLVQVVLVVVALQQMATLAAVLVLQGRVTMVEADIILLELSLIDSTGAAEVEALALLVKVAALPLVLKMEV